MRGAREMVVWGTGQPRREFVYVDDMAEGCLFLMSLGEGEIDRMLPPEAAPIVIQRSQQAVACIAHMLCPTSRRHGTPR